MQHLEDRIRARFTTLEAELDVRPGEVAAVRSRSARRRSNRLRLTMAMAVAILVASAIGTAGLIQNTRDKGRQLETTVEAPEAPFERELSFREVRPAPGTLADATGSGFVAFDADALWRSTDGEAWTREPITDLDADDWFRGYAEGHGWRLIWGLDGFSETEATTANQGGPAPANVSIAWVSRDGGPWVRSELPLSGGGDSGVQGGFVGPEGPVLIGHRVYYSDPGRPDRVYDDVSSRFSELGLTVYSWAVVDETARRIVAVDDDGRIVFDGTPEDLGLSPDALSGYAGPPSSLVVWTSQDGTAWTAEEVDPARFGATTVLNPHAVSATDRGLYAPVVSADGSFSLWLSPDGATWESVTAPPGHVEQISDGPSGPLAGGSAEGQLALWRSDGGGQSWTSLPPSLDAGARLVSVASGSNGVTALATTHLGDDIKPCPPELTPAPGHESEGCEYAVPRLRHDVLFSADTKAVVHHDLTAQIGHAAATVQLTTFGDHLLVQVSPFPDPGASAAPASKLWLGTLTGG